MKALLWKELRALAPWAALMLVVTMTSMVGVLVEEFNGYDDANFFGNTVLQMTVFGSGCMALILGFLQTVLEVRRDQWAFLMHRGRSATQIFLAKVSAGLLTYALIMLIPTLIGVAWCAVGGVERYPFSWYQLLPMLAVILASVSFYFAAILLIVWKGPWHFSRLLPLVVPVLLVMGVVGFATEITEYVPFSIFLTAALVDAILGVAAWGVFVRSGEAPGRHVSATSCLGVAAFPAIFLGFIGLFALAGAAYEFFLDEIVQDSGWRSRPQVQVGFFVNHDGHVCRLVHGPASDRRGHDRPILSATDLDEPQSNRYANLVGKNLSALNEPEKHPEWNRLPMASIWYRYDAMFYRFFGWGDASKVLQELRSTGTQRHIHGLYSSADGWVYFYQETYKSRGGYQKRAAPQLLWVVGPDGFKDPSQRPSRRFGKLLVDAGSPSSFAVAVWPDVTRQQSSELPRHYLLFEDGLYAIDLADRSVEPILTVPRRRRLRNLVEMEDAVAVVYDDDVAVHSTQTIPFGTGRKGGDVNVTLNLPGELRYSFPLPAEVKPFDRIQFGRVPDQDVIVFRAGNGLRTWDLNRFVHMRLDGTVLNRRDIRDAERLPPEAFPVFCGAALLLPAGPLLLASGAEGIDQVVGGTGPGMLVRLVQQSPIGMALVLGILIGSAACCAWSASRTARRYGFGKRERVAWLWVALLLGPAGLLTLWFVRDWPVRERCTACGNWRPVTLENCPDCGQTVAPPAVTGTEILEQRVEASPALATMQ